MTEPQVEAGDRALETARKLHEDTTQFLRDQGLHIKHIACEAKIKRAAALIQSAMNAQEREIAKLIDLYTGPTGGWLVAPIFLKEEIERLLAERGKKI